MKCKENGWYFPPLGQLEKYQWELNMKSWRTEKEEELQGKEANV